MTHRGGVQVQNSPVAVTAPELLRSPSKGDDDDNSIVFGSSLQFRHNRSNSATATNKRSNYHDVVIKAERALLYETDCDPVLETIESCVGCVEGVDMQHQFEEGLIQESLHQQEIAAAHGLSAAEAEMIRMQISSENSGFQKMIGSTLPDLSILNLFGCENEVHQEPPTSPGCGAGVVSPTDTTSTENVIAMIPDQSTRSLVDVAALSDPSIAVADPLPKDLKLKCTICGDEASIGDATEATGTMPLTTSSNRIRFVYFPCCEEGGGDYDSMNEPLSGSALKTTNVCMSCILVLTIATTDGSSRVGRCPRCRKWIVASTLHSPNVGLTIRPLEDGSMGQCRTCHECTQTLVEHNPPQCDACFLGKRTPLSYECQHCHSVQVIPYPMYRYQPSAGEFGRATRECHSTVCQHKARYWKICPDQLALIPAGDVPEEWGDDYLQLARAKVQEARRGIARLDLTAKQDSNDSDEGCVIL